MESDNRNELVQYRLNSAKERLHSAKVLLEDGSYKIQLVVPIMQCLQQYGHFWR